MVSRRNKEEGLAETPILCFTHCTPSNIHGNLSSKYRVTGVCNTMCTSEHLNSSYQESLKEGCHLCPASYGTSSEVYAIVVAVVISILLFPLLEFKEHGEDG